MMPLNYSIQCRRILLGGTETCILDYISTSSEFCNCICLVLLYTGTPDDKIMLSSREDIIRVDIERCKSERDIEKRIQILYGINSLLPASSKVNIPTLITNDYVNYTLSKLEDEILMRAFDNASQSEQTMSLQNKEHHKIDEAANTHRIYCGCGNVIEYDEIQMNCSYPEYRIMVCDCCKMTHRVVIDGSIRNVVGAL